MAARENRKTNSRRKTTAGRGRKGAMGIDGKTRALLRRLQEEGAKAYPESGCAGRHWKSWPTHVPAAALHAWIKADGKKADPLAVCPPPMRMSATILMTPTSGHDGWAPDRVLCVEGGATVAELPATHQLVTDAWRILTMPRLIYMPERDRLLLCVRRELRFHQYPADGVILLSDDRGDTWTVAGTCPAQVSNVGYLGAGRVRLGAHRSGASGYELVQCSSDDYGATWATRVVPGISWGGAFYQWGDWLVDRDRRGRPVRIVEPGYAAGPDGKGCKAILRLSTDGGLTWPEEILPPAWNRQRAFTVSEVTLCRAVNGTMVAACRCGRKEFAGMVDFYSGLGISLSKDDGRTWSKMQFLYDYGRHHASLAVLRDGTIVLAYVVRLGTLDKARRVLDAEGYPQWGVEAIVSHDHGETWDTARRYVLARWSGMAGVQDTSTVLLPDGSLLTAFGGGARGEPDPVISGPPIDIGLVRWRPENETKSRKPNRSPPQRAQRAQRTTH
jgi:hypothetical protein